MKHAAVQHLTRSLLAAIALFAAAGVSAADDSRPFTVEPHPASHPTATHVDLPTDPDAQNRTDAVEVGRPYVVTIALAEQPADPPILLSGASKDELAPTTRQVGNPERHTTSESPTADTTAEPILFDCHDGECRASFDAGSLNHAGLHTSIVTSDGAELSCGTPADCAATPNNYIGIDPGGGETIVAPLPTYQNPKPAPIAVSYDADSGQLTIRNVAPSQPLSRLTIGGTDSDPAPTANPSGIATVELHPSRWIAPALDVDIVAANILNVPDATITTQLAAPSSHSGELITCTTADSDGLAGDTDCLRQLLLDLDTDTPYRCPDPDLTPFPFACAPVNVDDTGTIALPEGRYRTVSAYIGAGLQHHDAELIDADAGPRVRTVTTDSNEPILLVAFDHRRDRWQLLASDTRDPDTLAASPERDPGSEPEPTTSGTAIILLALAAVPLAAGGAVAFRNRRKKL